MATISFDVVAFTLAGRTGMLYAQERAGQRLHIVEKLNNGLSQPLCWRTVRGYRISTNVPFGMCCKNCARKAYVLLTARDPE